MFRKLLLTLVLGLAAPLAVAAGPVKLYKNPSCMCCEAYANYLEHHGFEVEIIATHDLPLINAERGLPGEIAGCHTSLIAGYVVGGHVPVDSVRRLLREKPDIDGISVAGMPAGSPGMPGTMREPIRVWAFTDGQTGDLFATYTERPE
jgi:hypothetical protein